jgi:6-phosphogluconolactonase (cycloisomerase 2 family)
MFTWTRAAGTLLIAAISVAVLATTATAAKKPGKRVVGAVYTETNGVPMNHLIQFDRYSDGTIKQRRSVRTGGTGGIQPQPLPIPTAGPPICSGHGSGCPALDGVDEVLVTPSGKFVFAVNAGSNTVSSFKVTRNGPVLVNTAPTGGPCPSGHPSCHFPISVTIHGNRVFTLNADSLDIQGFTFDGRGRLTQIPGSHQALNPGATSGAPRQIAFDNSGKWLIVTKLFDLSSPAPPRELDAFPVNPNGSVGTPVTSNTATTLTFAVAFDRNDNPLVAEAGSPATPQPGTLESFSWDTVAGKRTGHLTSIGTKSTIGFAPCWVMISPNGKYADVVNADTVGHLGDTIAVFRLLGHGKANLIQLTRPLGEQLMTDDTFSRDGKYLYSLSPIGDRSADPISHVDVWKVGANGKLKLIQQTPSTLARGASGLSAF